MTAPTGQRWRSNGGVDPELCGLSWCEERRGHDGPHRRYLLDLDAVDVATWRPVPVQLVLQGESARVKALVLVTDSGETALTWQQARRLGAAVYDAAERWGTP